MVSIAIKHCLQQGASKLSEEPGNLYFSIALMFSLYTCALLRSPGKMIIKLWALPWKSFALYLVILPPKCWIFFSVFFTDSLLYLSGFYSGFALIMRLYLFFTYSINVNSVSMFKNFIFLRCFRLWFPRSLGKHFCVNSLLEEMMEYLMTILLKKGSKGWSSL